jgi:ATP-dependent exoDNAse (exonuclease V) beta subunit
MVLRDASLDATKDALHQVARTHGRLLDAEEDEIEAAGVAVFNTLRHPLLGRARKSGRVHRELPISLRIKEGDLFEGIVDLTFVEAEKWIVVDFKTDAEKPERQARYRDQVGWYMKALEEMTGMSSEGVLLHI